MRRYRGVVRWASGEMYRTEESYETRRAAVLVAQADGRDSGPHTCYSVIDRRPLDDGHAYSAT